MHNKFKQLIKYNLRYKRVINVLSTFHKKESSFTRHDTLRARIYQQDRMASLENRNRASLPDFGAKVGLGAFAELAVVALRDVQRNDMVSWKHRNANTNNAKTAFNTSECSITHIHIST